MKIPTLINSSAKINGELSFTTEVRIDGEVFGKVESDKSVIIGPEGYVKGFLRAKDLVVFGRVEGNIVVSGLTVLHENASVFGNLYTKVFEVKDGAIITARVVTYEKLDARDEAQIYLAEEMIKVEPSRRQIPAYSHVQISFDETYEMEKEDQQLPLSTIKSLPYTETAQDDSGDILSKMLNHNNALDEILDFSFLEENVSKDISLISTTYDNSFKDLVEVGNQEVIGAAISAVPEISEPVPSEMAEEAALEDSFMLLPTDTLIESDELVFSNDQDEIGEEDKFLLLSVSDEIFDSQSPTISESLSGDLDYLTDNEQNNLLEFDFDGNITDDSHPDDIDLVLFPLPKQLSIAECLGEPVKEDSLIAKKGKKKPYSSDAASISQANRKHKGYKISGFEELRNLLSPLKYQDLKPNEKKNEPELFNTKKVNDNDLKSKGSEKDDFFLNKAIRQLPIDDYTSLFN